MRKAGVPQFILFIATLIFGLFLLTMAMGWVGGGTTMQKAIEQATLTFTVTTSANALSTMDEGYVTKELAQKYDILVDQRKREGKLTNFYISITPVGAVTQRNLEFSEGEKACGAPASPVIKAEGGDITFFGKLETPNPCYKLSAELERQGNEIRIKIDAGEDKTLSDCNQCPASVEYSGKVTDLPAGIYKMSIIRYFRFRTSGQSDILLGSQEVETSGSLAEKSDNTKEYFFMHDVTPTVLQGVDCVKIIKTPGQLVRFEKCMKSTFTTEELSRGPGQGVLVSVPFEWYKTQVYD